MGLDVIFTLEPYGPGDCRLLRYLPGGLPIYEGACKEGSIDAWKNAAQSLCLAASLWANPPKSRDWELAGIARIEANKFLTSGCRLMDLMLGTTNLERGKKMMSTEPIDIDKASDDICKSSYNANLSEMLIGMTSRDQLLDNLIELSNNIASDFDSQSKTLTLSNVFLNTCQQLRQYFKISRIYKHYVDVDCTDIDFCCTCQVYVNIEIYNPIKLLNNPSIYPFPLTLTTSTIATLRMINHDKWNLEFYGNVCKYIQNKYNLIATLTFNGNNFTSCVKNGEIDLSQILDDTARLIHGELISAQRILLDRVILEMLYVSSLDWENEIVQLVDVDPDGICFHIDLPNLNGQIIQLKLSYQSYEFRENANQLEVLLSCVVYRLRDFLLNEWENYVYDAANRYSDMLIHWRNGRMGKSNILSDMFEYLLPKLTQIII